MKKVIGGLFLMSLIIVGISLLILKAQEEAQNGADDSAYNELSDNTMTGTQGQEYTEKDLADLEEYFKKFDEKGAGNPDENFQMGDEGQMPMMDEEAEQPSLPEEEYMEVPTQGQGPTSQLQDEAQGIEEETFQP